MVFRSLQRSLAVTWQRLRRVGHDLAEASRRNLAPTLQRLHGALHRGWTQARPILLLRLPSWWPQSDAPPPRVRPIVEVWHRAECWIAVAAFGFIAAILLLDVIGRELVGPVARLVGFDPGATGIFAAQKLSVFALVIGSFAGIGIATATGSHIVPRFAHGWAPAEWGPALDRLADVLTALFLLAVVWFGFTFVASSMKTDLRAPVLDWPVWPIQLSIPLGFLSAAGRYLLYAVWPPLKPDAPEFQE
jgi:TRAP-type C4-dicarboxylate transport system permease small subunit